MGLELFAKVDNIIDDDFINKITCDLINDYDMVYSRKKNTGFVHKGTFYQNSAPPLFDLSISMDIVILSMYGNLNEQNVIKNKIETIFKKNGLNISLLEEGEF